MRQLWQLTTKGLDKLCVIGLKKKEQSIIHICHFVVSYLFSFIFALFGKNYCTFVYMYDML